MVKHGASSPRTRTYMVWQTMRKRCRDKNHPTFKNYGGRGISVCKRWDDYSLFLKDMGNPSLGMTIERIDNDGNYEPSNCRWATRKEQAMNRRKNNGRVKIISMNGKSAPVGEWEKSLGLSQGMLWHRIKNGWTMDRALTTKRIDKHGTRT